MNNWSVQKWADEPESVSNNEDHIIEEETEDKSLLIYRKKTTQVILLIKEMEIPKPGQQLRLITKRSFNAISFLKYIAELEKIEHATLVIYSINYEAATIIDELLKSERIGSATILMSNLRNKAHRKKEQLTKDLFLDNPKIKLMFSSVHAKIISFKTKLGNYYTIEGSGNLSFNSRIEQYVIDNDKQIYEFTNDWINEMIEFLKGKKELILH